MQQTKYTERLKHNTTKKNYHKCFFQQVHTGEFTGKQLMHIGKPERNQNSYICLCILCFAVEAKT
jgi:hypothetical protein